jgi:hypothetical protein
VISPAANNTTTSNAERSAFRRSGRVAMVSSNSVRGIFQRTANSEQISANRNQRTGISEQESANSEQESANSEQISTNKGQFEFVAKRLLCNATGLKPRDALNEAPVSRG